MVTTNEIRPFLEKMTPEQIRQITGSNNRFVGLRECKSGVQLILNDIPSEKLYKKFLISDIRMFLNYWLSHKLCIFGLGNTFNWIALPQAKEKVSKIINPDFLNNYKNSKYTYATMNADGYVLVYEFMPKYVEGIDIFDFRNLRNIVNI